MLPIVWLCLTLLWSLACAILAVLLPAVVKKLGLFSIALGAAVAGGGHYFQGRLNIRPAWWQWVTIGVAAGLAEVVRVYESLRQFQAARLDALERQLEENPIPGNALTEELRDRAVGNWESFLAFRYRALKLNFADSPEWGWLLLALEVLLASGAAVVLWWYWSRTESPAVDASDAPADKPAAEAE